MFLDASSLSAEVLARASVIIGVFVLLLFSSATSIYTVLSNRSLNNATNFYLLSLCISDFLWASFVVPLSVYSSLVPDWKFMGDNSLLCKGSAYLQIVIMTSTMYVFAWLSVDRYSAFMKPSRYESEHTLTRCKCWIAFTWLTALLGALPIVAKMEANFYHDYEFCILNWSSATAYSITLSVLVLVPSFCTIVFTTISIFLAMRRPEELEDIQRSAIETDHNFVVTLFVIVSFFLAWLPIVVVHFIPESLINPSDIATMKFSFVWMAIGCSSIKFLIFIFTNKEFRQSLCMPCLDRESDVFPGAADENFISGQVPRRRKLLWRFLCFCCPEKPSRSVAVQRRRYGGNDNASSSQLHPFQSEFIENPSNYFNGGVNSSITKPFVGTRYQNYGSVGFPPGF